MRKFIAIFSVFLFISLNINIIRPMAKASTTSASTQTYSEGFYSPADLKLMPNVMYKVKNVSPYGVFMIVFDNNQLIQQSIRLEPNSIQYVLKPMQLNYKIVVIGTGQLSFTT